MFFNLKKLKEEIQRQLKIKVLKGSRKQFRFWPDRWYIKFEFIFGDIRLTYYGRSANRAPFAPDVSQSKLQ